CGDSPPQHEGGDGMTPQDQEELDALVTAIHTVSLDIMRKHRRMIRLDRELRDHDSFKKEGVLKRELNYTTIRLKTLEETRKHLIAMVHRVEPDYQFNIEGKVRV